MSLESDGGMIYLQGKPKNSEKNLSTTNPTCIDPGANPGLRGVRPATNDLSHGTANSKLLIVFIGLKIQVYMTRGMCLD
jgi:hypothetical protein